MTSKADANAWRTKKRLQGYGFDADPNAVRIHKSETALHVAAKRLCGLILQRAGHAWDDEVETPNGRIDVVDFGSELGEDPLAIEFNTNGFTDAELEDKVSRYVREGPCRDVLPISLEDAPRNVDDLTQWIEEQLAGT